MISYLGAVNHQLRIMERTLDREKLEHWCQQPREGVARATGTLTIHRFQPFRRTGQQVGPRLAWHPFKSHDFIVSNRTIKNENSGFFKLALEALYIRKIGTGNGNRW